jgi:hypothetical protein
MSSWWILLLLWISPGLLIAALLWRTPGVDRGDDEPVQGATEHAIPRSSNLEGEPAAREKPQATTPNAVLSPSK